MKYDIVVDTLMMLHQDENQAVVIYYADLWYLMLSLILGNIHKQLKQWDSSPETENNPREVHVMQQSGAIQRMHIVHREKSVDMGARSLCWNIWPAFATMSLDTADNRHWLNKQSTNRINDICHIKSHISLYQQKDYKGCKTV